VKTPKVDTSGTERANQAIAAAQAAANNLKTNFQADLGTENLTQVNAGGGADLASMMDTSTTKRRRPGSGLSSQLGLNVGS